jgi:hypothetical protein
MDDQYIVNKVRFTSVLGENGVIFECAEDDHRIRFTLMDKGKIMTTYVAKEMWKNIRELWNSPN